MRYELSDYEWTAIKPFLPNKPRGVPRVNDQGVLNGIFWVLRSGAPWRDLPDNFGPYTTCYNRFVRWRRAGVWGGIMSALAATHDDTMSHSTTSYVDRGLLKGRIFWSIPKGMNCGSTSLRTRSSARQSWRPRCCLPIER
jgi:transposase